MPDEAAWAAQQVEEEGWATLEDSYSGLNLGRGAAAAPAPAASFHSPTLQLGDEPGGAGLDDTGASQPPRGGGPSTAGAPRGAEPAAARGGRGDAPSGGHDAAAAAFGTAVMAFAFSQPAARSPTLPARAAPAAPARAPAPPAEAPAAAPACAPAPPAEAPPAARAGGAPREAAPEAGGTDALAAMLSTFGAAAAPPPPAAPSLPPPAAAAAGAAQPGPWRQRAGALGAQGPPPPPPAAQQAWLPATPGSGSGAAPSAAPVAAPPGAGAKRKRAAIAPDGSLTREISPTALASQFALGVAATRTLFGQQPPVDVALVPTAPCAAAAPASGAWMLRAGAGGFSARVLLAALGARAGDELRLTPLPAGHNGRPAATVALLRGGAPAPPPPPRAAPAFAPAAPAPPAAPPAEPTRFFPALEAGLPPGGGPPGPPMGRLAELKDALRESGVAAAWDVVTAYEALCEADPEEAGRTARSLIGAWRLRMPDAVREMAEDFLEEHADLV
jgi:hypothetical protein